MLVEREGQPAELVEGQHLTVTAIREPDNDGDLRGDQTEDRTDLTLTGVPERDVLGRVKIALTVANAGPLPADRPFVTSARTGRWEGPCEQWYEPTRCRLKPIAPGDSRTITFLDDTPATPSSSFSSTAEGPDLNPANNTVDFTFPAAQGFDRKTEPKQRLSRGVKVNLLAAKDQRARVTVAVNVRGRRVSLVRTVRVAALEARDITIRPSGGKLRSLRRALNQGSLRAEVTVRTPGASDSVTVRTTLTR